MTDHTFIEKIDSHALQLIVDNFDALYDGGKLGRFVDAKKSYSKITDKKTIKKILFEFNERRKSSSSQKYKYAKGVDYGRLFSDSTCLQGLSKLIRHTISRDIYWDIDISNAHPNILHQYCINNKLDMPTLTKYINHRDVILQELMSM